MDAGEGPLSMRGTPGGVAAAAEARDAFRKPSSGEAFPAGEAPRTRSRCLPGARDAVRSDARSRFSSTSRPGRRDACDQTSLGVIISTVAGRRGSRRLFTISSRGRVFLVVQASAPRRRRWRAASRTGRKRLAAQRAPVSSRRGESRVSGGCSAEEDSEPSPGLG